MHKFPFIFLLAFALCACKDKQARPASNAPIEKYKLDGVIVSLDPQAHIAKIKGEEIVGWMEAMTMEYPVKDHQEFDTLHIGDHITAIVFVQGLDYSIGEIHHVR
jgi:Cu/Ag efflux protein CusF